MPFTRMPCGAPSLASYLHERHAGGARYRGGRAVGAWRLGTGVQHVDDAAPLALLHAGPRQTGEADRGEQLQFQIVVPDLVRVLSDGMAIDWPALLITMSTLPNALTTPSKVVWISAAFDTSQTKVATRPPFAGCRDGILACSRTSGRRARIATSAPDAANSFAMARPSPMLAPVMMALRPSRRTSFGSSSSMVLVRNFATRVGKTREGSVGRGNNKQGFTRRTLSFAQEGRWRIRTRWILFPYSGRDQCSVLAFIRADDAMGNYPPIRGLWYLRAPCPRDRGTVRYVWEQGI